MALVLCPLVLHGVNHGSCRWERMLFISFVWLRWLVKELIRWLRWKKGACFYSSFEATSDMLSFCNSLQNVWKYTISKKKMYIFLSRKMNKTKCFMVYVVVWDVWSRRFLKSYFVCLSAYFIAAIATASSANSNAAHVMCTTENTKNKKKCHL